MAKKGVYAKKVSQFRDQNFSIGSTLPGSGFKTKKRLNDRPVQKPKPCDGVISIGFSVQNPVTEKS
jgi:hypothetical protein